MQLRNAAGNLVGASVSYSATNRRVTLNPNNTLGSLANYTVTITGGASGVKDLAGNPMSTNRTWTFRTRTL